MTADATSGAFAYDVSAINKLKYTASKKSDGGVHAAAKQFEALFIKQMLSSMRKAIPKSHLLGDSPADKQYQDMMDAQWSQTLAQRGMGLAKMLDKQLIGHTAGAHSTVTSQAAAAAPHITKATPRALAPSESLASIEAQRRAAAQASTQASAQAAGPSAPDATGPVADTAAATGAPLLSFGNAPAATDGATSAHVRDFLARFAAPAAMAAHRTGLPPRLILAQAALETGWGRHEITTDGGARSFNVFNIKSEGWNGASTDAATHEYARGTRQATQAGFRVYNSYHQAFSDYARLIDSSPRYAAARQATTPEAAAQALQNGGYATDPHYAAKLVSVMKSIPESPRGGLFAGNGGAVVDMSSDRGPLV
ncbi:flagellar assembly peptidoglycan hydrolase FlgJ [Salinisphaera sp. LB1]|uniref:flagellar assembly peptidoglycan hydrolase FlgJ n=1 Tax=Salinisphaera sp. LB1 TaxID=2183911 RepID=UPI000D708916|nr:flagellar assembly peptidoglycan hydrolase FlgJ [Salinisphaera sp. LB1]AWN16026.1 Flagellar protein FlgJ [peptidoglycan hydrolase] [Salinisphaera sp. LB1]